MTSFPLIVFFGHHKSATLWIYRIFRDACKCMALGYRLFPTPKDFDYDLGRFMRQAGIDFAAYTNAQKDYVPSGALKGLHVIRDPRDIAVSAYFSHCYSHPVDKWPELEIHRRKLLRLSPEEGLLADMEFNREFSYGGMTLKIFDAMRDWVPDPRILELKFEDLIAAPDFGMKKVFRFLGWLAEGPESLWAYGVNRIRRSLAARPNRRLKRGLLRPKLPARELWRIMEANRFERLSGRPRGSEDPRHHYRKGVAGDWKNYFKESHELFFKDHWGDLLIKFGYEKDSDW